MDLKFYLNKILKIDNIEHYTIETLQKFKDIYEKFLDDTEGVDPDYPGMKFNEHKGKKIGGRNIYSALEEGESVSDFRRDKLGGLGFAQSTSGTMTSKERYMAPDQMRSLTRSQREHSNKK